jgi:hypothetical protein
MEKNIFFGKTFFPYFLLIFTKSRSRDHYLEKNFFCEKNGLTLVSKIAKRPGIPDLSHIRAYIFHIKKTSNSWSFFKCMYVQKKKLVTFDFTLKGTLLGC